MKGKTSVFVSSKKRDIPNSVTISQRIKIEKGDRIIKDHLKEKDITGAVRDIANNPVKKRDGNGAYDHLTEVTNAIKGLNKVVDRLNNSLKNPNLDEKARKTIEDAIKDYKKEIANWNKKRRK